MAFLGMRGSGDWAPNERPENWRETILYLYPNGSAPLTAMTSMMGSERTDDPVFHWWTKTLPEQGGDVTDLFEDANLSSEVTAGKDGGDVVYAQVGAETASEFRRGHTALIHKEGELDSEFAGEVVSVLSNGTQSYVAVKLHETASTTQVTAATLDIEVIGNANAEGAEMPDSISYDPVEYDNFTQIFRTPLSITRTARRTRLRTGDAYTERKRETLEIHAIEIEKATLWGYKSSKIGANGKPKRTTQGLIPFIKSNASDNVDSFLQNSNYTGTWTAEGEDWLHAQLERIFRFGQPEKLGLVGNKALLALNKLAQTSAEVNIEPMTVAYGMRVLEWITPFGTVYLKTHPLFNRRKLMQRDMLITEPDKMMFRYVDDTFFIDDPEDQRNRNNSRDGTEEEYLTEGGYEYHHPETMGYLTDFGLDN